MTITPVPADALDEVLDLVAGQQADPSRGTTMLGDERDGIAAELGDLEPPWGSTIRVVREEGRAVAASLVEWDEENARAWVFGPWVVGGDDDWARWARALVEVALAQLPAGIERVELAGEVANVRMAALAEELGWTASEVNHVYAASATAAAGWHDPVTTIRSATAADRETIRAVHDQEFPATYATMERLLPDEPDGKFHVLIAEDGPRFLGYAAGRVQPDGDGYLDYLAVPDAARGHGAGRDLLVAIGRYLVDVAPHHDVNLTVQDHRTPARRLYESLGFELQLSIVGYSRPPKSG
jgi:ribosomal protein S18 acetylase RimI-like enzyme